MSKYEEMFQTVTDRIINNLENANDWRKPWANIFDGSVPHNASTGRPYNGINWLNLSFLSSRWDSNGWLTYKQATALGGTIPKNGADNGGCEYVWFMASSSYKDKATGDNKKGSLISVSLCGMLPKSKGYRASRPIPHRQPVQAQSINWLNLCVLICGTAATLHASSRPRM